MSRPSSTSLTNAAHDSSDDVLGIATSAPLASTRAIVTPMAAPTSAGTASVAMTPNSMPLSCVVGDERANSGTVLAFPSDDTRCSKDASTLGAANSNDDDNNNNNNNDNDDDDDDDDDGDNNNNKGHDDAGECNNESDRTATTTTIASQSSTQ
jgi:hypothetical protein